MSEKEYNKEVNPLSFFDYWEGNDYCGFYTKEKDGQLYYHLNVSEFSKNAHNLDTLKGHLNVYKATDKKMTRYLQMSNKIHTALQYRYQTNATQYYDEAVVLEKPVRVPFKKLYLHAKVDIINHTRKHIIELKTSKNYLPKDFKAWESAIIQASTYKIMLNIVNPMYANYEVWVYTYVIPANKFYAYKVPDETVKKVLERLYDLNEIIESNAINNIISHYNYYEGGYTEVYE